MKKLKVIHYTLVELLAAMMVFLILLTMLFRMFSSGSSIITTESTRATLLGDASVLFEYITNDLRNAEIITDTSYISGYAFPIKTRTTADYDSTEEIWSSLSFHSHVDPYQKTAGHKNELVPVSYYRSGTNIIRDLPQGTFTGGGTANAVICAGVESLEIKVWQDFPGGTPMPSPSTERPNSITIEIVIKDPNPNAAAELTRRTSRTISKTIFLNH